MAGFFDEEPEELRVTGFALLPLDVLTRDVLRDELETLGLEVDRVRETADGFAVAPLLELVRAVETGFVERTVRPVLVGFVLRDCATVGLLLRELVFTLRVEVGLVCVRVVT